MNHYIAFLRGMNLGKRRIKMDELRGQFEGMKFGRVTTFIASGNVIFESRMDDAAEIELLIEGHLERALGYQVDTFVRTRAEIAALASAQPFPKASMEDEGITVNVGLFKARLSQEIGERLARIKTDVDQFHVSGREYFWLCRIKMSDSEVWRLPAARALTLPTSTQRNLKTLRALAGLYPPPQPVSVPSRAAKSALRSTAVVISPKGRRPKRPSNTDER